MGINTRQSQHYRMLAEEEAARLTIIRALIRLAASSEDREAATQALDRLSGERRAPCHKRSLLVERQACEKILDALLDWCLRILVDRRFLR